ncbi:discoidin domain-containing protein [Dactylosporangium sp. NPDC000521]|uniref:discoidin domain-containing protein n=1 Tax=Dactylosporangium sp. NPDC000521 TaxID=3363975 RepID=UPI0036BA4E12
MRPTTRRRPARRFPALLLAATGLLLTLGTAGLAAPPAFTPVAAQVSAVAEDVAQIAGVRASAAEDINPAAQAVDGDLSTRWSGPLPAWLELDLGTRRHIHGVDVAWFRGDERALTFSVATSVDGVSFSERRAGTSSGTTATFERYDLPTPVDARYVRLSVTGNTQAPWASVSEVRVRVPAGPVEQGDLRAMVLAYRDGLPGENSHAFVDGPAQQVDAVVGAVRQARAGRLGEARATLTPLGYQLIEYLDQPTGRPYLVLREQVPCQRCWGLLVMRRDAYRDAVVEVPHPLHDLRTPEFGLDALRRLDATAFLMAGAHRYANGDGSLVSDMARNDHSLFQRLHQDLTTASTHVLQYHGFAARTGYPQVVLSNGSAAPQPELARVADALRARGMTAGVFDGSNYPDLGATQNPQGRHTRAIGGRFYHMEHVRAIRDDPALRGAAVDAVAGVLFPGSLRE